MSKTFISDIRNALDNKNQKQNQPYYGVVKGVITDGDGKVTGYNVSLGGDDDIVEARKFAGAKEGDIVLVTMLNNGSLVVTGTRDGDADSKEAIDKADDVTRRADEGEFDGRDGQDGRDGADGQDGKDGVIYYGTCTTEATTASKDVYLQNGSIDTLVAGTTISVKFSNSNTATNPKLDLKLTSGWSGYKNIMTNGVNYAYWQGQTEVLLTYDGTYWQVASAPVYASTVTVGNPSGHNVYIDSDSVDIRTGATVDASFTATEILLCRGKGRIKYDDDRGSLCIVPSATQQVYLAMQNNPYGTSYQSEVWLNRGDCGMYTVNNSTATLAAVDCKANGTVELRGQNGVKFTGNTIFSYSSQTCNVRPQASHGWLYCDTGFYSGSELRWKSTPSTGGTSQGQLYCKSSSLTGYYVALGSSSKYLKHDIEDVKDIDCEGLYNVHVRQFHWNEDQDETKELVVGLIADEVAEHFPQGAIYRDSYRDGKDPADWDDRQILPAMLKLIQDQHKEIELLKERLDNGL